jgi:flagellar protein FlaH
MKIISLGIKELDESIGGGIPHPSLISIEGEHGAGKTIFTQQIIYSILRENMKVLVITGETTTNEYINMMKSVKLDVTDYIIKNRFTIYPLHVRGVQWNKFLSTLFLRVVWGYLELKKEKFDCIAIDSLSTISTDTPYNEFLTFLTRIKNIVSDGKSIIVTFHPKSLSEDNLMRLKSASDVYLKLTNTRFAETPIKILEVVKLWGGGQRKSSVMLEIHPSIGLRVMPLGGVKL